DLCDGRQRRGGHRSALHGTNTAARPDTGGAVRGAQSGVPIERANANAVPGLDNYFSAGSPRCGRSAVALVRSATTVDGTVIADMLRFLRGTTGVSRSITAGPEPRNSPHAHAAGHWFRRVGWRSHEP